MTTPGVENASCEFNVETLSPTYRLLIGIPGKSNAFAISRRLGLPDEVITNAQSQMSKDSVRFEDVLTQLEAKRQALEKREQETDRLYRQREEDARKAREFREQMQRAKKMPAAGARPKPSASCGTPALPLTRCLPNWNGCGRSRPRQTGPSTPMKPEPNCAAS